MTSQADQRGLSRVVGSHRSARGDQAVDGRDVDHRPVLAGEQQRCRQTAQVQHRDQVDLNDGFQLAERLIFQRAVIAHPSVVDQDVEPAEAICYRGGHRLPVCSRSDITGHRDRIELTGQLAQDGPPAGRLSRHRRPLAQHPREPLAQARRGPCDQSHPACKKPAARIHTVIVPAQACLSSASTNLTGDGPKTRTRRSVPPGCSEHFIERRRIADDPAPSVAVCESRSVIWAAHRLTIWIRLDPSGRRPNLRWRIASDRTGRSERQGHWRRLGGRATWAVGQPPSGQTRVRGQARPVLRP